MIQQQHNSEIWHCLIQAYSGGCPVKTKQESDNSPRVGVDKTLRSPV